jgi:Ribosomal protein S10
MDNTNIRIRLKAFDHRVLDSSTSEIVSTAKRTGAQVRGRSRCRPASRSSRSTARRTSTRSRASSSRSAPTSACSISSIPTPQTVDALMKLDLASGVDVEIKLGA